MLNWFKNSSFEDVLLKVAGGVIIMFLLMLLVLFGAVIGYVWIDLLSAYYTKLGALK